MPVQVSYPGVYIEEIPSGHFVITGVATSITAFVGRAVCGPTDDPMTIFSFGDYERIYGGLAYDYPMSYAVKDFFLNGGSQAVIARLFQEKDPPPEGESATGQAFFKVDTLYGQINKISIDKDDPKKGTLVLKNVDTAPTAADTFTIGADKTVYKVDSYDDGSKTITFSLNDGGDIPTDVTSQRGQNAYKQESDSIMLKSANPGDWGNHIAAAKDTMGIDDQVVQLYKKYGLTKDDLFNLTVTYYKPDGTEEVERFTNVTTKSEKAPNYLKDVLKNQSQLVRTAGSDDTISKGYDGGPLDDETYIGNEDEKTGIYMLNKVDLFNLLCIPPDQRDVDGNSLNTSGPVYTEAVTFSVDRRAMLIVDPPTTWTDDAKQGKISDISPTDPDLGINGTAARNAAVYFPRVIKQDLEMNGQPYVFPGCGIIAGVMAATDVARGVWKAPAGQNAAVMGIQGLELNLTDNENGLLNPQGINCLRNFPIIGPVVWGARTLRGADQLSDDYKYVPVRRLTLYIEESVYRGTQWAVFEPNDESLWSALRPSVGTFLADLQRQGAFYNYTVACDSSTTTQYDIDRGIVNVLVAIAPVKPAEFVVIKIQQMAGQKAA
jgi:phage tail sheath protein FI